MSYRAGADFERRVLHDLERIGFCVIRSAGSKSPVDLVAMRAGRTVCIQCKRNGRMDPAEWNVFYGYCQRAGSIPVLAMKAGRAVEYKVITGMKTGYGRQPMAPWVPREA